MDSPPLIPAADPADSSRRESVMAVITNDQLFELQTALIRYVTSSAGIFLVARPVTWRHFYDKNPSLAHLEEHYSQEDLSKEFVHYMLPQIFSYALTPKDEACISMLRLHPDYERTAEGFRHLERNRRPLHELEPKPNIHYRFATQRDIRELPTARIIPFEETLQLDGDAPLGEQHHTLVVPAGYDGDQQEECYDYEFTPLTGSFLSAALASDMELSASASLEPAELHRRLRSAKRHFEQTGRLPPNCLSLAELLAKVRRTQEMRQATSILSGHITE